MRLWAISALFCACLLCWTSPSRACGAMVFDRHVDRAGGMSDQQVLVAHGAGKTMLVVSAGYADSSGAFAFVYPIAAPPMKISETDPLIFDALEQGTAPEIVVTDGTHKASDHSGGCICSGPKAVPVDGAATANVIVHQRGATKSYQFVVVEGSDGNTVGDWLTEQGFAVPPNVAHAIDGYLGRKWVFLAAKLNADTPAGQLAPLVIELPSQPLEALQYPLGLSAVSLAPGRALSTTMYLVGGAPFKPSNYNIARVDAALLAATSPSTSNYDLRFDQLLAQYHVGLFILERGQKNWDPSKLDLWRRWTQTAAPAVPTQSGLAPIIAELSAMFPGGMSLARLRSKLRFDQLRDMTFAPATDEEMEHGGIYQVIWRGGPAPVIPSMAWLLIALAGLWTLRRRTCA